MADKPISGLTAAKKVYEDDLFVLEQDGSAKKLTGEILKNWLLELAEGHGGIKSIVKSSTSGLTDTYRITFADSTTFDYQIKNGRSITGIAKTATNGLKDTYTISFNDGTTQTYDVTNGAEGPRGVSAYVWFKWASEHPGFESAAFGDIPDKWMGIYSGPSPEPPTNWEDYRWVKVEGKTAYEFAVQGGYAGTEEQFARKLALEHTTHLLSADTPLDGLLDTGMYYLSGEISVIKELIENAGIEHPVTMDGTVTGLVPKAIFVDVTRGSIDKSDPTKPVGQPHQHARIYYATAEVNAENPGVSYLFEFDRVHNVVGYEADGSSWGAWRSASKNAYTLEQERGKVYGPWAFDAYDQNLDNMNEPGATYTMFVDDNMRSKYPNLFSAINDMPAYRAVMRVGKRVDGGELFQEMVIYHRTVVGGVTTYATVNATRLLYGEPGERGWKVGKANLYGTGSGNGESAAPDTLIVEYGVTTAEELAEAVGVYKHIFCRNGDILLPMTKADMPYSFSGVVADQSEVNRLVNYTIVDGEWQTYERYITEEITEMSADIPTAGAVYDHVKLNKDTLLVTVDYTSNGPIKTYYTDVDYATIAAAVNKKNVIVRFWKQFSGGPTGQSGYQYYLYFRVPNPGYITFRSIMDFNNKYEEFTILSDGSCYFTEFEVSGLVKTTTQELTDSQKEIARTNIGAGTASEWSDLGESVTNIGETLTWDGNTEGKVADSSGMLFKVSDSIPTADNFIETTTNIVVQNGNELEFTIPAEDIKSYIEDDGFLYYDSFAIVPYDNYTSAEFGYVFPESGLYFTSADGTYSKTLTIPGYNFTETTVKPVPEKYLPPMKGVSSWNDLTDKPTTIISHGDTLTWDGVATGVCVNFEDAGITFAKVHHAVPASADLSNGITIGIGVYGAGLVETYTISPEGLAPNTLPDGFVLAEMVAIVPADNYTLDESFLGVAITFPEAGIYFASKEANQMYTASVTIPGYEFTTEKIKAEVLPGANLLTCNSGYIYRYGTDATNPENRMTCGELRTMVLSGRTIYVTDSAVNGNVTSEMYYNVTDVSFHTVDGQPTYGTFVLLGISFYTAEYVPPTT